MPTSRRPGRKPDGPPRTGPSRPWLDFEMEVVQGLEEFAEGELARRMGADAIVVGRPVPGRIAIRYRGSPAALNGLRSVAAVHMIESYEVARPRALLGHENLTRLRRLIEGIVGLFPRGSFETFRISAAGADSSTFKRLGDEIGTVTRLVATEEPARLQLAFRRTPGLRTGWQVLVRLSPMPLSARKWRVCDLPGALNATIAHVMVELAGVPQDGDVGEPRLRLGYPDGRGSGARPDGRRLRLRHQHTRTRMRLREHSRGRTCRSSAAATRRRPAGPGADGLR